MPSDDSGQRNNQAQSALQKLNAVRPKRTLVLTLDDFNTDGIYCLARNNASDHQTIAAALLGRPKPGTFGGEGYYMNINGNNHSSWGVGPRGNYVTVVDTLKQIQSVPLPAAELSAAATLPLSDAPEETPAHDTPSEHHLVTDASTHPHVDADHQPHDHSDPAPGNLQDAADTTPPQASQQLLQRKEYLPRTKTQKSAIAGGTMATAAGLAWLFTLLAHKESRDDIKLFWKKLLSPKIKKAVAQKNARMRSQINSHGKESIGALATTLAGIIALAYGVKRKQKQPSTSES
jgi:hypothetical protein